MWLRKINIVSLDRGSLDLYKIVLLDKFQGVYFSLLFAGSDQFFTKSVSSGTARIVEDKKLKLEVLRGKIFMILPLFDICGNITLNVDRKESILSSFAR